MEGQTTIFEMLYPSYKIKKPIRLIEFFAGYGSQALALKYLGVEFEHWKICEWAVKSIQAYKDIHFTDDNFDYSWCYENKEDIADYLYEQGISSNYNEPMTKQQISRLNEKQLRTIYNNIRATHNLVNVQTICGEDLEIVDTDKYDYILTYSFPCQDLSLAGVRKGMSDTSTRSGMLWEVERILTECKDLGTLPQILLMENVPQVHGEGNVEDFNKWQLKLEELGYKNYWQDLIATDYGIPQTRNRTFMVSILGDYNYTFPKPIPLKLKLKDMLEDEVDEKYFLSDKMLNCLMSEGTGKFPRKDRFLQTFKTTNEKGIAATLCTTGGTRPTDNFVYNKALKETLETNEIKNDVSYIDSYNKKIRDDELSNTITTRVSDSNNAFLLIKNANSKGYLEAKVGDGVDISSRMQYHRGTVQKGKTQTLSTMGGENNGVVVGTYQYAKSDTFMHGKDRLQIGKETSDTLQTTPKEGVVINPLKGISGKSWQFEQQIYDENGCARTLKAGEGSGNIPKVMTIGNYSPSNHNASRIVDQEYSAPTVMENHGTITATQTSDLRIRKLTPNECFRLMGVKDEDFKRCAKSQSDSSLWHLAGDSIVVNVLMAIFKEMI